MFETCMTEGTSNTDNNWSDRFFAGGFILGSER